LSLSRVWLAVALVLPALMALLVPLPAVDLAYQVRAGDAIIRTGQLPWIDTYTFTVGGQPWTDQQWLAQVLLSLGYRLGGWEALAVLRAALVAAMSGLLVLVGVFRGASTRTASILALLAFLLASPALALRPQLFAIVLFAGLLALVAGRERHPGAFLLAPVIVALWANLHGSFVLAPLLLGYAWLDDLVRRRPARRSFAVLVAGTLATLVNPFGAGVWAYAADIGANPVIRDRVSEWQHTLPMTPLGALFYVSVVGAALVAWRGRDRLAWPDGVWLLGLIVLGAWAVRGLAWWPPGAVLVLGAALGVRPAPGARPVLVVTAPPRPPARPLRLLNAAVVAVLGLALVAALPWWRPADPLTGRAGLLTYAPSGLAAALRGHVQPGTRVFVPQTWGSWFEWAVPDARYFVDARFELCPADVWADLDRITAGGTPAAEALDRRGVEVVVLPAGGAAPAGAWTAVYSDVDGSILVRTQARVGWYLRATDGGAGRLLWSGSRGGGRDDG
jgi:hypothetical protein